MAAVSEKRRTERPYRIFDHTADVGVEVFGETKEMLFAHAAEALFSLIVAPPVGEGEARTIVVLGMDTVDLWVNYLRELLAVFNDDAFVVSRVDVQYLTDGTLQARAFGETFEPARHEIRQEVKAVTYHQAEIRQEHGRWWGRFIVDV